MNIQLSVNNQSVETSGLPKDYREAICEYIWNGFEANAKNVKISFEENELTGVESISIEDDGDGIAFDDLSETFGAFLVSKKNSLSLKAKTKANKGKGRFSFGIFSTSAKWKTKYKDGEVVRSFSIMLDSANKQNVVFDDEPLIIDSTTTGTIVTFYNIHDVTTADISYDNFEDYLLSEFAWFLYLFQDRHLFINGVCLDFNKHINSEFSDSININVSKYQFKIDLIVWKEKIKEKFCCYFMSSTDELKGTDTTTFNRNTVDFNHSVFIKSPLFDTMELVCFDSSEQLTLLKDDEQRVIFRELKQRVQDLIENKLSIYMSTKADDEINKMIKERNTFPVFSNDSYGEIKKKDLIRVTKGLYCTEPKLFYKLKEIQEKSLLGFLNLLLSSEERENILSIVEQIVELTPQQRASFASILKKTKLENIIDTIQFVENRYKVIEVLKTLIYDLTKFTNERDHIQNIIETHYWLFGEQYNLVSADATMKRALESYINILYGASSPSGTLTPDEDNNRRMDIFMCGARQIENQFEHSLEENIVVELKAPSINLSLKVLRQIEDYMNYIRKQPQFASIKRRWKFITVCKQVADDVKAKYKSFEHFGKIGLVEKVDEYEIYALTWDDIFTSFDLRHGFMLNKLKFNRDELIKTISKDNQSRDTVNTLVANVV